MATLTNTKIKDTYDGLLKTTDNEALDVSGVTLIEDGLGNASALSVGRSGNGVTVTGSLNATLATASQPNITSVGTLTGLTTSGNITQTASDASLSVNASNAGGTASISINGLGSNGSSTAGTRIDGIPEGSGAAASMGFVTRNSSGTRAEKMRIDSIGNVAVKKDALLAAGLGYAGDTTSAGAGKIELYDSSTGALVIDGFGAGYLTNGGIQFSVAGSEKARILHSGGITFNGDTSSANALDDYEEGTWTPQPQRLTGGDITAIYSDRQGYYTKVGNMVTCSFYIGISSVSSQGSNLTRVAGLPFVPASNYVDVGVIGNNTSFDTIDVVSFLAHTQAVFYFRESGNTITNVNVDWVASSSVSGTITYRV